MVGTPDAQRDQWRSNEQRQQRLASSRRSSSTAAAADRNVWTVVTTLTVADVARWAWWMATAGGRSAVRGTVRVFGALRDVCLGGWNRRPEQHSRVD